MSFLTALPLIATSFLQPSGLPDCGNKPRPSCLMPDIPALEWAPTDRRYSWPLEANDPPFSNITYHRNPKVYGTYPPSMNNIMLEYCLIDEINNTAQCWSEWEYQTDAVCATDRWGWIAKPTVLGGRYIREDVREYHEHKGKIQVYLWEFSRGMGYLPNIDQNTPTPDVTFSADRTQVIRRGPTTNFSPFAILFVRDGSPSTAPTDGLFNRGITNRLPINEYESGACTASFIFATSWCEFAPWRPECPGSKTKR